MEVGVVQEEAATEVVVEEEIRKKVTIVSNTTDNTSGNKIQQIGTALHTMEAPEKIVVMVTAAADKDMAEDMEVKVLIINNIIHMLSTHHFLLHQVRYHIYHVVHTLWAMGGLEQAFYIQYGGTQEP